MKIRYIFYLLPLLLLTSCLDQASPVVSSTQTVTIGDVSFKMVYMPSGSFTMGSTGNNAALGREDEFPTHTVSLGAYYICETEITVSVWNAVMSDTISGTGTLPITNISYTEALEFVTKLNTATGSTFALPTEAQWEYAARGGANNDAYLYSGSDNISQVAVCSTTASLPVGSKTANSIGLYDMSGNVAEWCYDWYGKYSSAEQNMPTGPETGGYRVVRGGSYLSSDRDCRVSARSKAEPDSVSPAIGFRVILYPSTIQ